MTYEVKLEHLARDGSVKQRVVTDYQSIAYRRVVNKPGSMQIKFNSGGRTLGLLDDYDIFAVHWKNDRLGVPWHSDFEAVYRRISSHTSDDGIQDNLISGEGAMAILKWRQVGYPAGVVGKSSFTAVAAETLAKLLVADNCTSLATVANGRLREGDLSSGMGYTINVTADTGAGNLVSHSFHKRSVYGGVIEIVAPVAGGDFSMVRTGGSQYDFDFHVGQLGDDKRTGGDRVEFSIERGNMRNPRMIIDRTTEKTAAISAGQGRGSVRNYQIVLSSAWAADNDIEMTVDANSQTDDDGVISAGNIALYKRRLVRDMTFDVIQTDAVFYSPVPVVGKKTYDLGDLVVGRHFGQDFDRKIYAINVYISAPTRGDMFSVDVEMRDV